MKKIILLSVSLFIIFLTGCVPSVEYSVLEEEEINDIPEVSNYVNELQSADNTYKGYKVFDTSDEDKVVVISSGEEKKALKVFEVTKSGVDTAVTVIELNSEQSNPIVVIRMNEIVGAFYVFERVQYDGTDN